MEQPYPDQLRATREHRPRCFLYGHEACTETSDVEKLDRIDALEFDVRPAFVPFIPRAVGSLGPSPPKPLYH